MATFSSDENDFPGFTSAITPKLHHIANQLSQPKYSGRATISTTMAESPLPNSNRAKRPKTGAQSQVYRTEPNPPNNHLTPRDLGFDESELASECNICQATRIIQSAL